jgi:hypothetical protein
MVMVVIRKHTVETGVTTNPTDFIVNVEWDSLHVDDFTHLGTHTCDCVPAGITTIDNSVSVKMYPNPVNDTYFTVATSEKIDAISVLTIAGQQVIRKEGNKLDKQMVVETGDLAKGMYLVKIQFTNGRTHVMKLSVK